MILIGITVFACDTRAQTFNSGSSGILGDVVVTGTNEWQMPDNGEFHLNSLVIQNNALLTFSKPTNGLNPPVYLLARSNITIQGRISVDGQAAQLGGILSQGGPGGFAGGSVGYANTGKFPGDGYGPGRGVVGSISPGGAFGTSNGTISALSPTYGNFSLLPLIGGSGGAGCSGTPNGASGGGGGGAILLASDTRVDFSGGTISARGGSNSTLFCSSGGGSGGAIRIVAPSVTGFGTLDASGGGSSSSSSYSGGDGRVRRYWRSSSLF